ncbi:helix-turn-helix domain-containing protein [Salinicola tamaricis]|uniref:helix-turn-helix domain-containing protein n=1 Tax=Salinicola tamaricis TaxID=1771309 RepID=UPI001F5D7064|nr:LysR family transcriptional regulator [Salinicola tamaricis]
MKVERLPLNALRAFAEAARAESFKHAAARLGVTPGAVSRQIKQLEDRLGVALFARHANVWC